MEAAGKRKPYATFIFRNAVITAFETSIDWLVRQRQSFKLCALDMDSAQFAFNFVDLFSAIFTWFVQFVAVERMKMSECQFNCPLDAKPRLLAESVKLLFFLIESYMILNHNSRIITLQYGTAPPWLSESIKWRGIERDTKTDRRKPKAISSKSKPVDHDTEYLRINGMECISLIKKMTGRASTQCVSTWKRLRFFASDQANTE